MGISEEIASELTRRDLQINRLASGNTKEFRAAIRQLSSEVTAEMARVDVAGPSRQVDQFNRLEKLQEKVNEKISNMYGATRQSHTRSMRKLTTLEAEFTKILYDDKSGVPGLFRRVPKEELHTLADRTLIEGAVAQDWWKRQDRNLRQKFGDEMRQGLIAGENNSDLIRRIRGRREAGFKDGVFQTSTSSAERLIRTSTQSVAQNSREAMYKKNADVVRGIQALSTLDNRTSLVCISRSGASWDLATGKPLPESPRQEPYPGPTPWHWRCRTQMLAVLRSFEDLLGERGKTFDTALASDPGTQASMDGQVARNKTFEQVAKGWGKERIEKQLGPGRYKLWKDGKISFTDLVDQKGRPLTLDELEALGGGGTPPMPKPKPKPKPKPPAPKPADLVNFETTAEYESFLGKQNISASFGNLSKDQAHAITNALEKNRVAHGKNLPVRGVAGSRHIDGGGSIQNRDGIIQIDPDKFTNANIALENKPGVLQNAKLRSDLAAAEREIEDFKKAPPSLDPSADAKHRRQLDRNLRKAQEGMEEIDMVKGAAKSMEDSVHKVVGEIFHKELYAETFPEITDFLNSKRFDNQMDWVKTLGVRLDSIKRGSKISLNARAVNIYDNGRGLFGESWVKFMQGDVALVNEELLGIFGELTGQQAKFPRVGLSSVAPVPKFIARMAAPVGSRAPGMTAKEMMDTMEKGAGEGDRLEAAYMKNNHKHNLLANEYMEARKKHMSGEAPQASEYFTNLKIKIDKLELKGIAIDAKIKKWEREGMLKLKKKIHKGAVVNDGPSPFEHNFPNKKGTINESMEAYDKVNKLDKKMHKHVKKSYAKVMTWISERNYIPDEMRKVHTFSTPEYRAFHRPGSGGRDYIAMPPSAERGSIVGHVVDLAKFEETATHEFMHWYESRSPRFHKRATNFLVRRAGSESPRKLKDIYKGVDYDDWEIAVEDNFKTAYTGKIYGEWKGTATNALDIDSTEILSMGVEAFHRDPVEFWRSDPEFFEFIVNTLQGVDDKWD